MEACNHKNIKTKRVSRYLKNKEFSTTLPVCQDCDAELWSDEKNKEFEKWAYKQDKIRVQFGLSEPASSCLNKLLEEVPTNYPRTLARALIFTFIIVSSNSEGGLQFFNSAYETDCFLTFEREENVENIGFDISPALYLELEALSNVYEIRPNAMAWEAFHIMLSLVFTNDDKLRKYWEEIILPQLKQLLKVA